MTRIWLIDADNAAPSFSWCAILLVL